MIRSGHTVLHWQVPPPSLQLPGDEAHLWRGRLDRPPAQVEHLWRLLSDDERSHAARFHTAQLRDRFIAGRGTLRMLLGAYARVDPGQLRFGYTAYGKPYLEHPRCQPEMQFNLAHADDMLLLAFTRTHPIGVDIELVRRDPEFDALTLAARFFAPDEYKALLQLSAALQPIGFFNAWTRKEAFIKARGAGLSLPLDSFSVSLAPNDEPRITRVADDLGGPARWRLMSFEPVMGYIAALAVPYHIWRLVCFDLFSHWL